MAIGAQVAPPRPTQPEYAQSGFGQNWCWTSTLRGHPCVETISSGGDAGGRGVGSTACSQAGQWGLCMSPGNGFVSCERLVARLPRLGIDWPSATRLLCQTPYKSTHSQRSPNSSSSSKSRCDTMALPPSHGGAMGVSYLFFRLGNYPQDRGTRPRAWAIT